jgi:hypothetical protein
MLGLRRYSVNENRDSEAETGVDTLIFGLKTRVLPGQSGE